MGSAERRAPLGVRVRGVFVLACACAWCLLAGRVCRSVWRLEPAPHAPNLLTYEPSPLVVCQLYPAFARDRLGALPPPHFPPDRNPCGVRSLGRSAIAPR